MTTCKTLLGSLVLVCVCAGTPQAQPIGGPSGGHMKHEDSPAMMLRVVLKHADLTADQENRVRRIMEADHQNLRALFSQLRTANEQLAKKLFAPGAVQPTDLAPQVQQITQLRQQLMEQGVKTALAIREVLTPEQLAKVAQKQERIEKLQAEMQSILGGND